MQTNSAISISSDALVLLGGEPIASFNEDSTGSLIASQFYETTYNSLLTETLWHFATRTADLARHEERPDNAWQYKFALPDDYLYVVQADTEYYEIYERDLYAQSNKVKIEYIYPVLEENLPPPFVKALAYLLASQFAIPLTGNATRAEYYAQLAEMQIMRARRADSSQRPASQMGNDRLISVRRV